MNRAIQRCRPAAKALLYAVGYNANSQYSVKTLSNKTLRFIQVFCIVNKNYIIFAAMERKTAPIQH